MKKYIKPTTVLTIMDNEMPLAASPEISKEPAKEPEASSKESYNSSLWNDDELGYE